MCIRDRFRSVYLYAKHKVHINDIWLKAELAEGNTTGLLTPIVKLDEMCIRDRHKLSKAMTAGEWNALALVYAENDTEGTVAVYLNEIGRAHV